MGFDNGVIVKADKENWLLKRISGWVYHETEDGLLHYEISYWRKAWGLRNDIMSYLTSVNNEIEEYPLTITDLNDIIDVCQEFSNADVWNNSNNLWEWSDAKQNHRANIRRLRLLRLWMRWHPNAKVYFYDSY